MWSLPLLTLRFSLKVWRSSLNLICRFAFTLKQSVDVSLCACYQIHLIYVISMQRRKRTQTSPRIRLSFYFLVLKDCAQKIIHWFPIFPLYIVRRSFNPTSSSDSCLESHLTRHVVSLGVLSPTRSYRRRPWKLWLTRRTANHSLSKSTRQPMSCLEEQRGFSWMESVCIE